MRSRTFTIGNLLWLVLACAIVQGVILAPGPVTGTAFALGILGILATSLLAIAYRRGRRRAGWIGFATFAWSMAIPLFWAMLNGPGFRGNDRILVVAFWTFVPIFGFVGSLVARRLHDTRDPPPAPVEISRRTGCSADPEACPPAPRSGHPASTDNL